MVKVKIKVNIGSWGPPQEAAEQYAEMVARAVEFQKIAEDAEQNQTELSKLKKLDLEGVKELAEQNQADLETLQAELEDAQNKLNEERQKVYNLNTVVDMHESSIDGLYYSDSLRQEELDVHKSESDLRFTQIETDLSFLEQTINEVQAEIDMLVQDITTIQTDINDHEKRINSFQKDINDHEKRINSFQTDINDHEERINSLVENSQSIGAITEWCSDVYNNYDSLGEGVTALIKANTDSAVDSLSENPLQNKVVAEELRMLKICMPQSKFFANDWNSGVVADEGEYISLMTFEDVSGKIFVNVTVNYDDKDYLISELIEKGLVSSETELEVCHTPEYHEYYGMYIACKIKGVTIYDELIKDLATYDPKTKGFTVYYFEK